VGKREGKKKRCEGGGGGDEKKEKGRVGVRDFQSARDIEVRATTICHGF
jgi:hypothetical protein